MILRNARCNDEIHRQRIFENSLLRDIFGYMREEVKRLEKLIIGELHDCYPSKILLGFFNQGGRYVHSHVTRMTET